LDVGRDGTTLVIQHAPRLEILATNRLNEPVDTSPAIVDKQLFVRGQKHLYCIEGGCRTGTAAESTTMDSLSKNCRCPDHDS
jgi:hypothetical protein